MELKGCEGDPLEELPLLSPKLNILIQNGGLVSLNDTFPIKFLFYFFLELFIVRVIHELLRNAVYPLIAGKYFLHISIKVYLLNQFDG